MEQRPEGERRSRPSPDVQQELAILQQMSAEAAREKERAAMEQAKQRDRAAIDVVERELASVDGAMAATNTGPYHKDLYGDFAGDRRPDGKIELKGEAAEAAKKAEAKFPHDAEILSDLLEGEKIAVEYKKTRTGSFRAQTKIVTLPDGRKIFLLYDYKGSWVHRTLDSFMKGMYKLPMRKADPGEWKELHRIMTSIPVIENADRHMVMMPYIPNANAKDVFAHNLEIQDFGTCGWANTAGLEEKNTLATKIIEEMHSFHQKKGAWGEAVLSNVIFTEKQKPVLCDFEVVYEGISFAEARARDLKDMCVSISSALEAAHAQDPAVTVKNLLDSYKDPEVIGELKKLASQKRSWSQNLFFGYEKARTGAKNKKQYNAIHAAIMAYETLESA